MNEKKNSSTKPKDVPFGITNAVLAYAIDLAGIPGASPPCINLYDADLLFQIGGGEKDKDGNITQPSRFAGMDIVEAAKAAAAERSKGKVTYRFERAPNLEALCKAFSDQESQMPKGATVNTTEMAMGIAKQIASGEIGESEGLVRLACVILKTYITFKGQCFATVPTVMVKNAGRTTETDIPGGGKHVTSPGFRTMSVNASAETRRKLKI